MRRIMLVLFVQSFFCLSIMNCNSNKQFDIPPPPRSTWISLYDSLARLLVDNKGQDINTLQKWEQRRKELQQMWGKIFGDCPRVVPSPHADTLNIIDEGKYIRYHLRICTEVDVEAEAYLLVPKEKGPFPGVVCFHSTSANTIDQPAGLADPENKHFGKYLAERGYVAIMSKNYIFEYRKEEPIQETEKQLFEKKYPSGSRYGIIFEYTIRLLRRYPRWTGLGKMIWDGSRCIDFLQSLPEVRKDKIGVIGHSLGGKEALFVAAFDSRITAAVSSEGGIGLTFSNWFDPWYIGTKQNDMKGMENHQVLSFIAPRPFFLIAGEGSNGADGNRSYAFIQHAKNIYKLYNAEDQVIMYNHNQGHNVTMEGVDKALAWLDRYLK